MRKTIFILTALTLILVLASEVVLAKPATSDINRDGKTNVLDLSLLLSNWGANGKKCKTNKKFKCDLNNDRIVSQADLDILIKNWSR